MDSTARSKAALAVIILLLILAISLVVTAYGYSRGSGLFPRFVGWIFVGLALLELALQLKSFLSPPISGGEEKAVSASNAGTAPKEIRGFLWIGLFLAVLYFAGFMAAIPLYIFTFLRFSAKRKIWESAVFAVSAAIFVNILFVQFMHYNLYPGVFLGG